MIYASRKTKKTPDEIWMLRGNFAAIDKLKAKGKQNQIKRINNVSFFNMKKIILDYKKSLLLKVLKVLAAEHALVPLMSDARLLEPLLDVLFCQLTVISMF